MKKLAVLMMMFGFVSLNANADVGRHKESRVDCSKVIQSIQDQLKRSRSAGAEAPMTPRTEDSERANSRPAQ